MESLAKWFRRGCTDVPFLQSLGKGRGAASVQTELCDPVARAALEEVKRPSQETLNHH